MKKKWLALVCLLSLFLGAVSASADELMDITRKSYPEAREINRPRSSLIMDGNTGDIIWQDNIDEVRDPASMSKLMTLYLLFEAMSQGKLSEETVIKATQTDQKIAGIYEISNNKIVAGVDYTISELITMTVVPSSNATTVMIANYLSNNDPDAFLDQMNSKAKELAMVANWFFMIPALSLTISAVCVLLFSADILYDISRIVNGGENNYISATLSVYLDIYNIFVHLLNLLMAFTGSRD